MFRITNQIPHSVAEESCLWCRVSPYNPQANRQRLLLFDVLPTRFRIRDGWRFRFSESRDGCVRPAA